MAALTLYRVRYAPGTDLAKRLPDWSDWTLESWDGQLRYLRGLEQFELDTQTIEPVPADHFSDYVLRKATHGVEQVALGTDPAELSWRVTSSDGRTPYRVRVLGGSGFLTCTCPHGRYAGGHARCYHVAAVLALVGLLDGVDGIYRSAP